VSDANAATGRLAGNLFAGGKIKLDAAAARQAIDLAVGQPLGLEVDQAGRGIIEIVDENMASAARIHAIERGHNLAEATMAAFGGAAPLHACQLACRLKIDQVIIPEGAGVGSARGFLSAPIANEMVRTQHMALHEFDPLRANQIIEELSAKALELVRSADTDAPVTHSHYASMRYVGQGYEIDVRLPAMPLDASGGEALMAAFEAQYRRLYGNTVPNVPVEVITWRTRVSTQRNISRATDVTTSNPVVPPSVQQVFDSAEGQWLDYGVYIRSDLRPGDCFPGPALVLEQQTTTVVTPAFDCDVSAAGHLVLTRKASVENHQRGAAQ
jgi:N-methylhydantoinase A